jgi:hypothetical protein
MRIIATIVLTTFVAAPVGASEGGAVFAHDDWDAVLAAFVDDRGLVDYAGLARDRDALDRYLAAIAEVGPESTPERFPTRDHELTYYINAYNALVFAGVLGLGDDAETVWGGLIDGYPFFVGAKYRIDGRKINLRNLENKVVRARYGDARIHAALNCASLGCPRLPDTAFRPGTLDATLDAAMTEFVSDPRHVRVDDDAKVVHLSKIFDWFRDDFLDDEREVGNDDPSLIDYVNRFRGDAPAVPRDYDVKILKYDEGLNRAPPRAG